MASHFISKSTYLRGLQCLKALYLHKYHAALRDPLPWERQMRFQAGHETGFRARDLFPGGVDASPRFPGRYKESVELCAALIKDGVTVIYEAAFQFEGVLVLLDILVKTNNGWIAYEVKSNINISNTYVDDAALQYFVITGSGLALTDFKIVHLNKPLSETNLADEPENIFRSTSVLNECLEKQQYVAEKLTEMRNTLAYPRIPAIEMGPQCNDPYTCEFIGFCSAQKKEISEGLFS